MKIFRLPDFGEGLADAEVIQWQVAPGDDVAAGAPLLMVETDKAEVEVASPRAGRVAQLLAAPGELVAVGAPLLEFEDGELPEANAVVGELPEAPVSRPSPAAQGAISTGAARARAVPAVRVFARRVGVDLSSLAGTGPGGAVTRADVVQAATERGYEPLRGVRLAMARNMTRAGREVVPATVHEEAEVEAWCENGDVMLRMLRGVAAGCSAAPELNAWLAAGGSARRMHNRVDCGIAVQTKEGLFVPVLRAVNERAPELLRRELDVLVAKVEARSIVPEDLHGATITLSNFGSVGGRFASLVVVPPQVAIVGAGRIGVRVCARGGVPALRRMLPLSLSFDHRAVTGVEAARFLVALVADLEQPE